MISILLQYLHLQYFLLIFLKFFGILFNVDNMFSVFRQIYMSKKNNKYIYLCNSISVADLIINILITTSKMEFSRIL